MYATYNTWLSLKMIRLNTFFHKKSAAIWKRVEEALPDSKNVWYPYVFYSFERNIERRSEQWACKSLGNKFTKKICGKGKFQIISSMSGMLLKIKLNMKALKNAKKGFHIILVQLHICENTLFKDTPKAFDDLKKK